MRHFFILAVTLLASSLRADGTTDIPPDGATTFTISAPGSYVLVRSVTMTTTAICIDITADDVTLDLNGHTLAGFPGGGKGIDTKSNSRLTIINGTVRNFGGDGIFTSSELRARDLTVRSCGGSGISAETLAEVHNVLAIGNQGYGIEVGDYAVIESCRVLGNGKILQPGGDVPHSAGLKTGHGSTISNCVVRGNSPSSDGIRAHGILTGDNCAINGNTATANNGGATANGIGIKAGAQCVVSGNTASENVGAGRGEGWRLRGRRHFAQCRRSR